MKSVRLHFVVNKYYDDVIDSTFFIVPTKLFFNTVRKIEEKSDVRLHLTRQINLEIIIGAVR